MSFLEPSEEELLYNKEFREAILGISFKKRLEEWADNMNKEKDLATIKSIVEQFGQLPFSLREECLKQLKNEHEYYSYKYFFEAFFLTTGRKFAPSVKYYAPQLEFSNGERWSVVIQFDKPPVLGEPLTGRFRILAPVAPEPNKYDSLDIYEGPNLVGHLIITGV